MAWCTVSHNKNLEPRWTPGQREQGSEPKVELFDSVGVQNYLQFTIK